MKQKIVHLAKSINSVLVPIAVVAVAAAWFWVVPWLDAQVSAMGGGTPVQGTTNGPMVVTNTQGISIRPLSVSLSGGTNAATVFIGNLYASLNGSTNGAYLIGSFTNSIGTGAFSTNIAAFQAQVPVTLFFQAVTGTNTETVSAIYGP